MWSISTGVSRKTLRVYNWGEYIDKTVISDFEDKFDCRIIYETFDSNEIMYTKYMSGNSYDVLVPSEYMIERMIKEDSFLHVALTATDKLHLFHVLL